jgi:ATP-dependent protease ClpP protease subunit
MSSKLKDLCQYKSNENLIQMRVGTEESDNALLRKIIYNDNIGFSGMQNILHIMARSRNTILYLDTEGGSSLAAIFFNEKVIRYKYNLTVVVTKVCNSSGLIVLATGKTRIGVRGSTYIFHSVHIVGPKNEQLMTDINNHMCQIFASVSKYSVAEWLSLMDGNDYIYIYFYS